jgi:hypothetical protein
MNYVSCIIYMQQNEEDRRQKTGDRRQKLVPAKSGEQRTERRGQMTEGRIRKPANAAGR